MRVLCYRCKNEMKFEYAEKSDKEVFQSYVCRCGNRVFISENRKFTPQEEELSDVGRHMSLKPGLGALAFVGIQSPEAAVSEATAIEMKAKISQANCSELQKMLRDVQEEYLRGDRQELLSEQEPVRTKYLQFLSFLTTEIQAEIKARCGA